MHCIIYFVYGGIYEKNIYDNFYWLLFFLHKERLCSYYEFKTLVSKGTYIRSLIYDINTSLNIIGSMNMLIRTKQGKYKIEESYTLEDIKNNNYKILPIESIIDNKDFIKIDDSFYKIIKNGSIIENKYDKDFVNFMYNDKLIAIYKIYEKDNTKMKPYKMFI